MVSYYLETFFVPAIPQKNYQQNKFCVLSTDKSWINVFQIFSSNIKRWSSMIILNQIWSAPKFPDTYTQVA